MMKEAIQNALETQRMTPKSVFSEEAMFGRKIRTSFNAMCSQ